MKLVEVERAVRKGGLELPGGGVKFAVVGQDPILASPHYLGNGVGGHAAGSPAWRPTNCGGCTGRSQEVEVDARHAAAALPPTCTPARSASPPSPPPP